MRNLCLQTKDHERISAVHYERGAGKPGSLLARKVKSPVVILAHGFFNAKDAYLFREIAQALADHYDVIAFDFRGHGLSSGCFTWTSQECADVQAVIQYAQDQGYKSIGLMGFSLGAAISLIEAAQNPAIQAVIAVSAPYDFWKINYHFWKPGMIDDLKLNLGFKAKGKGVRPGHPWQPKIAPLAIVEHISPRPVLFIHGSDDWLINEQHSQELYKKAKEPKDIVILKRLGHAETMFDQDPALFMKTCLDWLDKKL